MSKKTIRHENIIKYLKEHSPVKSTELLSKFNIKKSTLSEDLKELKEKGYAIDTSVHGYIHLDHSSGTTTFYMEELSNTIIRKWLVIYAINIALYTNGETYGAYSELTDIVSSKIIWEIVSKICSLISPNEDIFPKYMLRKDIRELVDCGCLVECYFPRTRGTTFDYNMYTATHKLPRIAFIDEKIVDSIKDIFMYTQYSSLCHNLSSRLAGINDKNLMRQDLLILDELLEHSYQNKCISFNYRTEQDTKAYKNFAVVLVMYSFNHDIIYVCGSSDAEATEDTTEFLNIEYICDIEETNIPNKIYAPYSKYKYSKIIEEYSTPKRQGSKLKNRYVEAFLSEYREAIDEHI